MARTWAAASAELANTSGRVVPRSARNSSGAAVATLLAVAGDDAKAITTERDADERASALRSLGVEPGGTVVAMAFGPGLTLYAALLRRGR